MGVSCWKSRSLNAKLCADTGEREKGGHEIKVLADTICSINLYFVVGGGLGLGVIG